MSSEIRAAPGAEITPVTGPRESLLEPWQAQLVYEAMEAGYHLGLPEDDLGQRRADAAALLGVGRGTVNDTSAQPHLFARRALRETGLIEGSSEEVINARATALAGLFFESSTAQSDHERSTFEAWAGRNLGADPPEEVADQVQAALARYAVHRTSALRGQEAEAAPHDTPPEALPPHPADASPPPPGGQPAAATAMETELSAAPLAPSVAVRVTGANANYDNDNKKAWRVEWEKYLDAHFPKDARAKAKVLCFASKDPWPEIDIYLRLGFRAENIYIPERNPKAFKELKAKLAERPHLKFNVVRGELEDNLEDLRKHAFGVVSLDFIGQMNGSYLRILTGLRLAQNACVLFNAKGNRESKETQRALKSASALAHLSASELAPTAPPRLFKASAQEAERKRQLEEAMEAAQENSLGDAREDGIKGLLVMALGSTHWQSPYLDRLEKLRAQLGKDERDFANGFIALGRLVARAVALQLVKDTMTRLTHDPKALMNATLVSEMYQPLLPAEWGASEVSDVLDMSLGVFEPLLENVFISAVLGRSFITSAENHPYESGISGSPFKSFFVSLESLPKIRFRKHLDVTAKFLADVTLAVLEAGPKGLAELSVFIDKNDARPLRSELWAGVGTRPVALTQYVAFMQSATALSMWQAEQAAKEQAAVFAE